MKRITKEGKRFSVHRGTFEHTNVEFLCIQDGGSRLLSARLTDEQIINLCNLLNVIHEKAEANKKRTGKSIGTWVCPKCGRGHSLLITSCECGPDYVVTSGITSSDTATYNDGKKRENELEQRVIDAYHKHRKRADKLAKELHALPYRSLVTRIAAEHYNTAHELANLLGYEPEPKKEEE